MRGLLRLLVLGLVVGPSSGAFLGCAGRLGGATALEQAAPRLRLPGDARPLRYAVELAIDPRAESFPATIDIELELLRPLRVLWLHGSELEITSATLARAGAVAGIAARVLPGGRHFVGLDLGQTLPPGPARLRVAYRGRITQRDHEGVFSNREGDHWYQFTQFEAIAARRAFPCFDEPSYKVPWRLAITTARGLVAVSNTPVASEAEAGPGRKRVVFAETPPLPSYLIAFAVGPFEIVDAGRAGRNATPLRILTPAGRSAEARVAAEVTEPLLERLEEYFGLPYAYPKLDSLAVFGFPGAMEHPGLITYAHTLLLHKPGEETIAGRRAYTEVAAHELGHQWFGNLVTMAWWDDIWLNESFASWIASKIVEAHRPAWGEAQDRVASRGRAMSADSLLAARRIREPIVTDGDIDGAFDAITYAKGQAVLEMFEAWIGPAAFQAGVRRYLARHAGGTATTADFLAALSEAASASDVALVRDALGAGAIDLRAAFSSFLDQAGVPMVSARLTCDPGPARLRLAQARYLPDGVRVSGHERWQIPICVRWGGTSAPGTGADPDARDGSARVCYLLDRPVAELPLSRAPSREASCPEWVQVNAGMAGYYRVRYEGDLLGRLLADGGTHLAPAERLGLLGDLAALVSSGALPAGHILEHVPALVGAGRERHLTSLAIDLVAGLRAELVPPELVAGYERFVGRTFGARARELGWQARGEDDDDTRLLRPQLVAFVADRGGDVALRAEAQRLATLWLDDPRVVEPDVVGALLATAAAHGDATLWQRLHDRLAGERQLRERTRLLHALAAFRSPALLAKNHALVLSPALEPSEAFALLMRSGGASETHVATYELVKRHYDALVARSPRRGAVGDEGLRLASVAAGLCDPAARADAAAFFGARTRKLSGGDRALDQILERIDQCIARKRRQAASVREFLARQ